MTTTRLQWLFEVSSPIVYAGPGEAERAAWTDSAFYARPGTTMCVRRLRGAKARTVAGLMDEVAAAFQFFDGFGENWQALEECLSYLDEWLPADGYVTLVEDADQLLIDEADADVQLAALVKTFDAAGQFWATPVEGNGRFDRPPRPFHLLLHADASGFPERVRRAGASFEVKVRTTI